MDFEVARDETVELREVRHWPMAIDKDMGIDNWLTGGQSLRNGEEKVKLEEAFKDAPSSCLPGGVIQKNSCESPHHPLTETSMGLIPTPYEHIPSFASHPLLSVSFGASHSTR